MQLVKNGVPLNTLDDWREHAPPKNADQWMRGRTPLECASAWFAKSGPAVPAEIQMILDSSPDTTGAEIVTATPGHAIRFDRSRGEPFVTDVVATAESAGGRIAISIEAKADEPFDQTVEHVVADAVDRRAHGEKTGVLARVEQLAAALLPPPRRGLPRLGGLRYQLLAATAGALAYAAEAGAPTAVLIVHEFVPERSDDRLRATNYADLSAFVARLSDGRFASVEAGTLLGPIAVPGAPLFERPAALYVGKAVRKLRAPAA